MRLYSSTSSALSVSRLTSRKNPSSGKARAWFDPSGGVMLSGPWLSTAVCGRLSACILRSDALVRNATLAAVVCLSDAETNGKSAGAHTLVWALRDPTHVLYDYGIDGSSCAELEKTPANTYRVRCWLAFPNCRNIMSGLPSRTGASALLACYLGRLKHLASHCTACIELSRCNDADLWTQGKSLTLC